MYSTLICNSDQYVVFFYFQQERRDEVEEQLKSPEDCLRHVVGQSVRNPKYLVIGTGTIYIYSILFEKYIL